jgi:hypothetical protein
VIGGSTAQDSVQSFARDVLQPLDLILNHQFAALEFNDPEIVGRKMPQGIVQLILQKPMFAFQLNEMRFNCHSKSPFSDGPQL